MSNRFSAADRLTRLLAVIPWVARHPGASLDEIVNKFAYPKDDLVGDLTDVVQYVGVPPYTPDTMIEVTIEDEHVWIHFADYFNRPMRLTTEEAGLLLSAGRAVLGVMGDDDSGPLLSALAKLTSALEDPSAFEIRLGDASEETMAILRTAIAEHRQVHIDYYSYGRDQRSERTIDPGRFFSDEGQWYVAGYCHLADADRVFRVDRIRKATLLDTLFDRPTDPPGLQLLDPAAGVPRVVIDVAPERGLGTRSVSARRKPIARRRVDSTAFARRGACVDRTPARTSRSRRSCRRCAGRPRDCRAKRCRGTYPRSIRQMTRGKTSRQDQSTKAARERHSP